MPNIRFVLATLVRARSGMPAALGFDQAVALPVVWVTAHHCFVQSQLRSLQDALVHAASGGVGLASVEMVMKARATIHGTAGGLAKHVLLRSCNVVRLSSSRDAAACAALLSRLLRGRRLHSLVNSLSNDFISLSLGLLASQGVLLEIGKNSIWSHDRALAAQPLLDYVAVAVDDGCRHCPGWNVDVWWFNGKLRALTARACAGDVQPLLFEGVAFHEHAVRAALRLLQRGANLGKLVVLVGLREPVVDKRQAPSIPEAHSLHTLDRGADLGTLVHLSIESVNCVAVLELHDPELSLIHI